MASEIVYSHDTKALLAAQPKTDVIRDYRWTAPMFYRALAAGVFGLWPKVEMIQGRLVEHPGQTPRHAYTVTHMARCFRDVLEPALQVREHGPIAISNNTHADTDILVVRDSRSEYEERHPGPDESLLLVEVSDLTAEYDLGEKAALYAQAGIADYWVMLANEAAIVVHRKPALGKYQNISRLTGRNTLSPLAMPGAVWTINALLGRIDAP